jgi:phytoene/squalene synthetase
VTDSAHFDEDLDDFLDKWRGRWPEWRIARVFVPDAQHARVEAWFALLQEWTDAAWAGADPTPGFAKLGWWQEELQGWARGGRRHPLGRTLQRQPAPWAALAAALPALQGAREPLRSLADPATVAATLQPMTAALDTCERALFPATADGAGDVFALLAAHALWHREDTAEHGHARDWAGRLCTLRPARAATRPRRIHDALSLGRLQRVARGRETGALPPFAALWQAWRAARG